MLDVDFESSAVLCVGDVMLDRYIHGDIARISPEAPVPVIRLKGVKEVLGGAGNAAHNIATLGGHAVLIGLMADDPAGAALTAMIQGIPRIRCALVTTTCRPTISKTRYIASGQQIVRTDEESPIPLQPEEERALMAAIDLHLPTANALLLCDYDKAALSRNLIAWAIDAARARGIPVFVDPKKPDFRVYRGATCITPNLLELALASKMPVDDEAAVTTAALKVMVDASAEAILVTRSEKGMMLVESDGSSRSLPSRAREVFDVSGAGDTVIATMALAHAAGMRLSDAMKIANAAAGVVVSKSGTATVTMDEVLHEIEEQEKVEGDEIPSLVTAARTASLVARWRQRGLKVGFTNGCFDILHPGHVALLKAARGECDRLIVALNTDDSVRRLKGPTRPINDLTTRAQVIASIRYVDCVVAFDEDTPLELIRRFRPDVLIKGGDYSVDTVVGADVVQAAGGRVFLANLVPGKSTTSLISRVGARALKPRETT
jgi:D-beta-D-heptose 7-phosphate kinase/D-beta-D-heptose 1-phosphate adenosyltransferase